MMKSLYFTILALVIAFATCSGRSSSGDAGIGIAITEPFVQAVQSTFLPLVPNYLNTDYVFPPNVTFRVLPKFFGTQIVASNFAKDNVTMDLSTFALDFQQKENSIRLRIPTITSWTITFDYVSEFLYIPTKGKGQLILKNFEVDSLIHLDYDARNQIPFATFKKLNITFGQSKIILKGGIAPFFIMELLDRFKGLWSFTIDHLLLPIINHDLKTRAKDILSPLLKPYHIPNKNVDLDFNFDLTEAPQVTDNAINLFLKGEFYQMDKNKHANVPDPTPINIDDTAGDLVAVIEDYTINTLFGTLYNQDKLEVQITNALFKDSIFKLNTQLFQYLIPGLYKTYGLVNMEIDCEVINGYPKFGFTNIPNANIKGSGDMQCKWYVFPKEGKTLAFTTVGTFNTTMVLQVEKGMMYSNITSLEMTKLSVIDPKFPVSNIDDFTKTINVLLVFVMRAYNLLILNEGMLVPKIFGYNISDIALSFTNGAMTIVANTQIHH